MNEFFSVFSEPLEVLELSSSSSDNPSSESAAASKKDSSAKIRGIISSESADQQGDTILQDGLDFSYFLNAGFLNDDHKPGAANVLGEPIKVESVVTPDGKKATAMVGKLYLDKKQSREIYDTACAMKSAASSRRLGFSIEGQVLQRDPTNPKVITRARVLHVAITNAPVNPDATGLEILARSANGYDLQAAMKARAIIQANGELCDPRVMMEVQKQLQMMQSSSPSIGYQTPAVPDQNSALSALVPSSISAPAPKRKKEGQMGEMSEMTMGGDPMSVATPMTMGGDPMSVATPMMMGAEDGYAKAREEVRAMICSAAMHIVGSHYADALKKEFDAFYNSAMQSSFAAPSAPRASAAPQASLSANAPSANALSANAQEPGSYEYDPTEAAEARSEKAYTRSISRERLCQALQQAFPNLDSAALKKLAANLVYLAKKRV